MARGGDGAVHGGGEIGDEVRRHGDLAVGEKLDQNRRQKRIIGRIKPGDGGGSQVGPIGAYDGNITKAVLLCCSSSNCPGNTELSGLFCGECTGPEWLDYVPYRNCSGVDMLIEPICS